jgi:anti-sigma factor RsiW
MMEHVHDDIEEFAIGGLPPERATELLRHADACPTCAVLVSEAMSGVAVLAQADGEKDVRRALVTPLVRRTRRSVPASWAATAAAVAACIGLLIWNIDLQQGVPAPPIAALVHSHFAHHELQGQIGSAKVLQALDGHWVYVVADGLAPRERYVLWEKRGGAQSEIGEFSTDGAGRAAKYFEQAPGAIDGFAVTTPGADPTGARSLRWP